MTVVDTAGPRPAATPESPSVRELATQAPIGPGRPDSLPMLAELGELRDWLERERRFLAAGALPDTGTAPEWFLDNAHLLQRVLARFERDLPPGFRRRLPTWTSGTHAGTPRMLTLARAAMHHCGLRLDGITLSAFVAEWQVAAPLETGELWALPTLLRLALVEALTASFARIEPYPSPPRAFAKLPDGEPASPLDSVVPSVVRSLRVLENLDWRTFFEQHSHVERALRRDPAGVYARMDFETRDAYRKAVEELADVSPCDELQVAEAALKLATAGEPGTSTAHVGDSLVGRGRAELERRVEARPRLGSRVRRTLLRHATGAYLGAVALATLAALLPPVLYARSSGAGALVLSLVGLFGALPASAIAVVLVHWLVTRVFPPRRLPRMDFSEGIAPDFETVVVIPTLLGSEQDAHHLVRQLELHYLGNNDPALSFALLTDFLDADVDQRPEDERLLGHVRAGIELLNARHRGERGGPFHLLHRERRWNPGEGCWMGWERKRGKLEEFNRWLGGARDTSIVLHVGEPQGLAAVRFVITLDTDTRLPRSGAAQLVGILAHPLNHARFDARSGRVVDGYTVIQPRTEIAPDSGARTGFARLFSGDSVVDIYSNAVSDVYQDLFGVGLYVGKGIYDWRAFERSLHGRAPENALASHDLFEGLHGRVALASDLALYEEYPSSYLAFARRQHRWIRGDWQLLPWLFPRVPAESGGSVTNRFTLAGRWNVFDNLRRSLVAPALLLFLAAGWTVFPGSPLFWTLMALFVPVAHVLTDLLVGLTRSLRPREVRSRLRGGLQKTRVELGRWFFHVAFLPHEARVACDAIGRTLVRLYVTRRSLLEWSTAAHTSSALAARGPHALAWGEMIDSPLTALTLGALVAGLHPAALPIALPLLVLWAVAPELARRISQPHVERAQRLEPEALPTLRKLARQTWLFYETFVGPDDHWLPPDNYQESPLSEVAHRTSPTNIGMLVTASLAAFDFGYLEQADLLSRLRSVFETLGRLEHHRGHLLNWYDTRSLEPLLPRYVSSVDSGNLAASLVVLEQGCAELAAGPILRSARWDGLLDAIGLSIDGLDGLPAGTSKELTARLRASLEELHESVLRAAADSSTWVVAPEHLLQGPLAECEARFLAWTEGTAPAELREIGVWIERTRFQLKGLQRDVDSLLAPVARLRECPAPDVEPEALAELGDLLVPELTLDSIPAACRAARATLARLEERLAQRPEARLDPRWGRWSKGFSDALDRAEEDALALRDGLLSLAVRAGAEVSGMEFRALYDEDRQLFSIGLNLSTDQVDVHHYDLLASEARLLSFLAIAKGDVPLKHWFHLGRPMTRVGRSAALLSWSATMFEYLMPNLWLSAPDGTLLSQSAQAVVDEQRRYARLRGVPWGISESCYFAFDADQHYQYRAFGVPTLGFKRGLEEDLVVAPYASLLALELAPKAVLENLARLRSLGMIGTYGAYESIDFTPARIPPGSQAGVVRAYMAHHQGMVLMALANALASDSMRRRFAASAVVQTSMALLYEEVPHGVRPEKLTAHEVQLEAPQPQPWTPLESWQPERHGDHPEVLLLGNGRLSTLVTDSGAGWLRWQGRSVTRWTPDATRDGCGLWVYVRDEETGELFSIARQPTHVRLESGDVRFFPHLAHFERRERGLELTLEVAVAPTEDVEVRRISVRDRSGRARRLSIFTGAELALGDPREVERHPAFARLFDACEGHLQERALVHWRRSRTPEEDGLAIAHRLVANDGAITLAGWQTDRALFLGRGGSWSRPRAVHTEELPAGAPLDPVLSLCAGVELAPHAGAQLAFTTSLASSPQEALALSARFVSLAQLDWLVQDAERERVRGLARRRIDPALLPAMQRVLSLLLHPHAALRPPAARLAGCRTLRPALWAHGISGDLPILLLHQAEGDEIKLFLELLRAQSDWREQGAGFDLVVLGAGASSYEDTTRERLYRALVDTGVEVWLGRDGGVHLVRRDQITPDEVAALEVAARVVLDASHGGLDAPLFGQHPRHDVPPSFAPARGPFAPPEPTPELEPPTGPRGENGLGDYSADGRGYVIRLPQQAHTPAPWSNVLANEGFGCLTSESGLGCSWSLNSGENRLTPWSNDPVCDEAAEVLYLRDEEDGRVWTTTPLPLGTEGEAHIQHGAGTSEYRRSSHGLRQRMTVIVPPRGSLKAVEIELENLWARPRRLTVTYYAEWVLGTTRAESAPYLVPDVDPELSALFVRNPWSVDFPERVAFLAASEPLHSFTADRAEFLGREGELGAPAALRRWGLSRRVEAGSDPCAALQVHVELKPGERRRLWFVLGQEADRERAVAAIREARQPHWFERAHHELDSWWDELLGVVQVETPDAAVDPFVNRFGLLQAVAGRLFGRTAFYQSSGAFGFRDQLQDVLSLLHVAPALARRHLLECAGRQFEEGDVLHWWHPPVCRGVRTRCSDDLLWLPYVVAAYVEATGDGALLGEEVAYLSAAPLADDEPQRYGLFESGARTESVLAHCRRALERAWTSGPHGLPLMGDHDWNDAMSLVGHEGRGESVWLAWFALDCARSFARLCERVGEKAEAADWRRRASELAERVEAAAWDGDWYLRAFFDDGTPLGSHKSEECRIDSIAQSWSVLCGAADPARAARATDAAERRLVHGAPPIARLFEPPFDQSEPHPGYIRGYPPGVRENGGQYSHAAAWLALALIRRGEPDRALRVIHAILPGAHTADPEAVARYRVEPYVVAADVYSGVPYDGRGGWTWYTGAAAWTWRVLVEGFLGLRPVEGGLEIDPCLPSAWREVRATVRVGRATYAITIEDPDGVHRGVGEVELDGEPVASAVFPRGVEARRHEVRVRLRRPEPAPPERQGAEDPPTARPGERASRADHAPPARPLRTSEGPADGNEHRPRRPKENLDHDSK